MLMVWARWNVASSSAKIVDWGDVTVADLLAAWNNVMFENVKDFG